MPLSITHKPLLAWVEKIRQLTNPKDVYWADGSQEEADRLFAEMIANGSCIKLTKRENCYYFRSDPADTARVEARTYICSDKQDDAGPLNVWKSPQSIRELTNQTFKNAFEGRTLYVCVSSMGPIGSSLSKICVQITDSPYVIVNARVLTRMGQRVADLLNSSDEIPIMRLLHATTNDPVVAKKHWPCHPEQFFCAHFTNATPDDNHVVSFGSGYGGNALLGKKCVSLRMASIQARNEGWLAEHMLIMGVTNQAEKETTYLTCALPSACGKTNLAMTQSSLPNITITTMGDDIAWLKECNGRLYAINAENGFFGVVPGTSSRNNPTGVKIIEKNTIFTNVGIYPDGSDIWYEGCDGPVPQQLLDWRGKVWTPDCGRTAAHPNSRFTSPLTNCPILDPNWDNIQGVPISGIMYGGRRSNDIPVVYQAFNTQDGVFAGLTCCSETTAAQEGQTGQLRNDPFAMKPFLAYHIGDYVQHLLTTLNKLKHKPLIFHVNWFRRDPDTHKFLWPGFSDNTRILAWICGRIHNKVGATESVIGLVPRYNDIDWTGLDFTEEQWQKLMTVDPVSMRNSTLLNQESLFLAIGKKLPAEMIYLKLLLSARL